MTKALGVLVTKFCQEQDIAYYKKFTLPVTVSLVHDSNAVKVILADRHIGYLPSTVARRIASKCHQYTFVELVEAESGKIYVCACE